MIIECERKGATHSSNSPESSALLGKGAGLYRRGRAGFASAGVGKREGPGLQLVSNKWILNFISPFDRFRFLEVFCPKISSPQTYINK